MANHPHDKNRPPSNAVKLGVEIYNEEGDVSYLRDSLSPRQRAFCEEYVVDHNGSAAAIRAGYAIKWADRQASQLLRNSGIRAFIDSLMLSKEAKSIAVNPDYVLQGIVAIASKEGARDSDKLRAFELIAKHLGMFIDRTEISGKDGEAIRIEEQRVAQEADGFLTTIRRIADKNKETVQ